MAAPSRRRCWLDEYGLVPYQQARAWQHSLVAHRVRNPELADRLLLLEHPPVYTLGKNASLAFCRFDPATSDVPLYRVERGGEITYHCPGQIVGYPILNLRYHQPDLHWYLRQLEATLIQTLHAWGLRGERRPGLTGVWLHGVKVASVGIKVRRWIAMHGFALNVCPQLQGFERIVPCGIADCPVGSLAQFVPSINCRQVRRELAAAFAQTFVLELVPAERQGEAIPASVPSQSSA